MDVDIVCLINGNYFVCLVVVCLVIFLIIILSNVLDILCLINWFFWIVVVDIIFFFIWLFNELIWLWFKL